MRDGPRTSKPTKGAALAPGHSACACQATVPARRGASFSLGGGLRRGWRARRPEPECISRRVTRELEKIVAERGMPEAIPCDNGPEFTSRHFLVWAMERKIDLVHIEPGRPVQNTFVESFHGKLRTSA